MSDDIRYFMLGAASVFLGLALGHAIISDLSAALTYGVMAVVCSGMAVVVVVADRLIGQRHHR